jgi:phosphinothricin acetyltransferase
VILRLATTADAGAVRDIYAPVVETTAISFEVEAPSEAAMAARIAERQPTHPWLVATGDDGVAGYACAGPFKARPAYDWSVETSVYVASAARRRGVGQALYHALLEVLTAQGFRQAMAGIALPNAASVTLHERAGFAPVGVYRAAGWKLGSWHDVGWWQRRLASGDGEPRPPIPVTALAPDVIDEALRARAG